MIKLTKRLSAALAAALIMLCMPLCTFAAPQAVLTDDAELFSSTEQTELLTSLNELSQKTGWVAVIYTNYDGYDPDNIFGHSNKYYADNYGKTTAGIMLNIDMGGRAVDFCTKGDAMQYFSDNRVDDILDEVQWALKQDDFYGAATVFVQMASDCYDAGIPTGESNENIEMYEKEDNPLWYVINHYGIIILLVSFSAAALTIVFIKHRYKNNGKENIYDLHANSKTVITASQDEFLHKSVSVSTVSSSSSSSGGSSGGGHSSGGGGSRGGGSRGF